jgi:hypothetical protein
MVGDDYWPDGHVPDAEGKYITGDLVCVKIPIEKHIEKRREASDLADRMGRSVKTTFDSEIRDDPDGASIPKEWTKEKEDESRRQYEGA